jgi:hypothetical protein
MPEMVIVTPDKCHLVCHDHILADFCIALNLTIAANVAVVADREFVRRPEDDPTPRVKASTKREFSPFYMYKIRVAQQFELTDQFGY